MEFRSTREMDYLQKVFLYVDTLRRLGLSNVAHVAWHRFILKTGARKRFLPQKDFPAGQDFFSPVVARADGSESWPPSLLSEAEKICRGQLRYFAHHWKAVGNPPDWFLNPFNGASYPNSPRHWTKLPDFHPAVGDIKNVWEASRFGWAVTLAQAVAVSGNAAFLDTLNQWLKDWAEKNPENTGPNWKCGQEASIRVMHLAMAALLLGQHSCPTPALTAFICAHLKRIAATLRYAMAQNNNHGTSEAAALFIGGTWLTKVEGGDDAERWAKLGRQWLENRVTRLVAPDGSFSQYSVNYHRVLLDTLSMVAIWRRASNLSEFSERFQRRCGVAAEWLVAMMAPETGHAPNWGANDGARLFPLTDTAYGDFRPSARLAYALFKEAGIFNDKESDALLHRLKVAPPLFSGEKATLSRVFPDGGVAVLRGEASWAVVRFAAFRFRPGHADCLHFDLWHRGENILRDGGSYSYHTEDKWLDYFSGTASHNTVQFDERNQMPRLGRFLFGAWLKMEECSGLQESDGCLSWTGAYTDWQKARHRRTVSVSGDRWRVRDEISGFKEKAILRWRLNPDEWVLEGNVCSSELARITLHTEAPVRHMALSTGWESLFYQQKTELPVLEIEVGPGRWVLETEMELRV